MRKVWFMVLVLMMSVNLFTGLGNAEASTTTNGTYPIDRADGGTITVSNDNSAANEGKDNAFDNNLSSKWLVFSNKAWIQYQFANNQAYAINSYSITAANDYPERDPLNWTLKGSNDSSNWTTLDTRNDIDFDYRYKTMSFTIPNSIAYTTYKLELQNNSGSILQLAEINLYDGKTFSNPPLLHPSITASGENAPNEVKEMAIDGTSTTKWLTFQNSGWLQFDYGEPILIDGYAITAANDAEERDPKDWTLKASNDGTNWTVIDTKVNENFIKRHQRNNYFVTPNTAYRYYKLELLNNSGNILQLGEVDFSNTDDMWHSINPIVEIRNLDTAGNGYLFEQTLSNSEQQVTAIVHDIVRILYADPGELLKRPQKIVISIVDEPGVAWANGTSTEAQISFSSRYLKDVHNSNTPLKEEIIGILYHELTHVYQYDDNAYGEIGYMIEGMADAVRFEVGYHDRYLQQNLGGNWQDSYGVTGNFLRWISEHKRPGFLREINASLNPFDGVIWTPDAFEALTGMNVTSLWNEYQEIDNSETIAAPTGLISTGNTDTSVNLSWTAPTNNQGIMGYDVYRDGAKIDSSTSTVYTVAGLSAATIYTFTVKAKDTVGHVSEASNSITVTTNTTQAPSDSQTNRLELVVSVPSNTPDDANIYLASSLNGWNPSDTNYRLTKNVDGTYSITLNVSALTDIQYKFTKGSWETVEISNNGSDLADRTLKKTGGEQIENLSIERWKDQ